MTDAERHALHKAFTEFCDTIATLRHPEMGCPWDVQQTHKSLRKYMIEEAYEASAAMAGDDAEAICDELGDVLLQVVLNAQVASDAGQFHISDVIKRINEKMRRRHPHVFKKDEHDGNVDLDSLHRQWHEIKAKEQGNGIGKEPGIFAKRKVEKVHPATSQAYKIGRVAADINFDWSDPDEAFRILKSEFLELESAWSQGEISNHSHIIEELGDVYFSLAQLCRHLKEDPELIAQEGNNKFLRRFARLETQAQKEGIDLSKASRAKLLSLWQIAKSHD